MGLDYFDQVQEKSNKVTMCDGDSGVFDHCDVYSCLLRWDYCVQLVLLSGKYETPQKSAVQGEDLIHNPH